MNMICGLLLIISTFLYSIGTSAAEKKSYRGYTSNYFPAIDSLKI